MKLRTNFCLTFSLFLLFVLLIQNAFPQEELVPIRAITDPGQNINRLDFSPNGQTLAGCGADDIWLWNPHNGTHLKTFSGHTGWIESIMFSPDGRYLASGGEDTTVRVWDANTGQQLRTLNRHTARVLSVVFSPDGRYLASGARDRMIRVWDANTGQQLRTLTGHTSGVAAVVFSPDGQLLVSGGEDAMIRVWDADTGQQIGGVLAEHTAPIRSLVFSPDGQLIASSSEDSTLRLWNPWTGEALRTLRGHTGPVYAVAFSPDGGLIVSGGGTLGASSADNTLRLWDPQTGELLKTLTEHDNDLEGLAFNPIALRQNEYMLASGDDSGTVILWRLTSTPEPLTFTPSTVADQTFEVGTPVNLTLPTATAGTEPYTYSLSPIPIGLQFDTTTQLLSGTPTTATPATLTTYTATDATGASGFLTFSIEVTGNGPDPGADPLDVDGDGQVTVLDLAIVALFYGMRVPVGVSLPADVNADGVVNLADLIAVAQGIDAAGGSLNGLSLQELKAALLAGEIEGVAGAPMGFGTHVLSGGIGSKNIAAALADVRQMAVGDVRLGKELAVLEGLLALLAEMTTTPETTALLPNYPNPFNPETWIPYHLAKDAEVIVRIYDMRGVAVRELVLGYRAAGVYQSRGRAAYWNGRNHHGEPVASGVYFYTLTAGDFTATRKMLIRK